MMPEVINGMSEEYPESAGFWAGLNHGKLLIPHCKHCDRFFFPPSPGCPSCGSPEFLADRAVSGRGDIYSWTVVYYPFEKEFVSEVPFVVAEVRLEEGPRLYTRLEGVDVTADLAGLEVTVGIGTRNSVPYLVSKVVGR